MLSEIADAEIAVMNFLCVPAGTPGPGGGERRAGEDRIIIEISRHGSILGGNVQSGCG